MTRYYLLFLPVAISFIVTAAAAAQVTKYGAAVTPEKNVDYTKLQTYSWRRANGSPIKTIDAQIVAAIDRELAALGMMKAEAGSPDVFISYSSLTRTDVDLKGKTDAKGLLPQHSVGTLVVLLHEPSTDRRLLRMRVDVPIETDAARLAGEIDRAVNLMFAQYPTRQKK